MAALDVYVSSSATEAFPNVLGEAMASGVPCVATDVGDSNQLIGKTGSLVPPREPARLSHACLALLELPREDRRLLGLAARKRVAELFDLRRTAGLHLAQWSASALPRAKSSPRQRRPRAACRAA
jgi:glycosyltransferase involved in cell wall biosynthesis